MSWQRRKCKISSLVWALHTVPEFSGRKTSDWRVKTDNQMQYVGFHFIIDKNCYESHLRENWRSSIIDRILNRSVWKVKAKVAQSCPTLWPHGPYNPRNSPGQNTGVGSLSLHGITPTQGSNPGVPHCRRILYQLSHKGSPRIV